MGRANVDIYDVILWFPWLISGWIYPITCLGPQSSPFGLFIMTGENVKRKFGSSVVVSKHMMVLAGTCATPLNHCNRCLRRQSLKNAHFSAINHIRESADSCLYAP